jgi:phage head maturation protease
VQRVRADLDHVSVVRVGAYPGAVITSVRGAQSHTEPSRPLANLARLRR